MKKFIYLSTLLSVIAMNAYALGGSVAEKNYFPVSNMLDQIESHVERLKEVRDNLNAKHENIEVKQNSYKACGSDQMLWSVDENECVGLERDCITTPEKESEEKQVLFILDASYSMLTKYGPPKKAHDCPNSSAYVKDMCGSLKSFNTVYPGVKYPQNPTNSICGGSAYTKYCTYCRKPSKPTERVLDRIEYDPEGFPKEIYKRVYITDGPKWDKYQKDLEKYNVCTAGNVGCTSKWLACKADALSADPIVYAKYLTDLADYRNKYNKWRDEHYFPYTKCSQEARNARAQCIRDFDAIHNPDYYYEPLMDTAKRVVAKSIRELPDDVQTSMVVYEDCNRVLDYGSYEADERDDLINKISKIDPKGATPVAASILAAVDRMKYVNGTDQASGQIVLVTDGAETCLNIDEKKAEQMLCKVVKNMNEEHPDVVINVLDLKYNESLSCVAKITGGTYTSAAKSKISVGDAMDEAFDNVDDSYYFCPAPMTYETSPTLFTPFNLDGTEKIFDDDE